MNTTDPHSRIIPTGSHGVLQGYNVQAAASGGQVVVAAEVTATTNDQTNFVPMAQAAVENLAEAGHQGRPGTFVADAGYWSAANATAEVGAEVLIATRELCRLAPEPSADRLAVLARVNRGELSLRPPGPSSASPYTWVRHMTERDSSTQGQRLTDHPDPQPDEWIPVIERLDRGEISQRAARETLGVSTPTVKTMLAHIRGEAPDPVITRRAMERQTRRTRKG